MLNLTDNEFQRLTSYMQTKFGINLTHKRTLVEGRLNNYLLERGIKSYSEYLDIVMADGTGNEITTIINKLTTNHTFFMREPEHYNFLRNTILPNLEKTLKTKEIRIWSAGCSSGEECYTTAMLLDDYFGTKKSQWDSRILATDISMKVLTKASEGIYQNEGMKDLPPSWITKYFKSINKEDSQINETIKKEVIFKTFNLMDPMPQKYIQNPFDLIFCRNVMIYFDMKTKTDLVNRFYTALKPGGYLFVGHAESVQRDATLFEYIKPAIYRRPLNK